MKSPISWLGGKSRVVKKLLPLIPEDHICYVEAFGGAGWLLFAKTPSKVEVLNDLDGDLMNFWSIVKNAPKQLINSFDYSLISRRTFEEYRQKFLNNEYDDCIERAHVFYYILKLCFGSKMSGTVNFGISKSRPLNLNMDMIESDIMAAYQRIKHVTIENEDFRKIIRHYDSPDTLFYFDPPYLETEGYRSGEFGINEYIEFSAKLKELKGEFILTVNDHEQLRELLKGFNIIEHDVLYTLPNSPSNRKPNKELIYTNF